MVSTTNWNDTETWQRVVASMLATGVKVDLKETAKYFGCTYDTLENRFRKLKKDGAKLKEEVESGARGEVVVKPATPRKPKTPKKDVLSTVANGRVSKASPSKKESVKQEDLESNASFDAHMTSSFGDAEGGSFFDEADEFN